MKPYDPACGIFLRSVSWLSDILRRHIEGRGGPRGISYHTLGSASSSACSCLRSFIL